VRHDLNVVTPGTPTAHADQELLGRDRELSELLLALARPEVRSVEITGPGGIGKSTLAAALLREQAALDRVRVLSVPLEHAHAASQAAAQVAVALGVQVQDQGNGLDGARERVGGAATAAAARRSRRTTGPRGRRARPARRESERAGRGHVPRAPPGRRASPRARRPGRPGRGRHAERVAQSITDCP